jgi:error-prone DNA polymerase
MTGLSLAGHPVSTSARAAHRTACSARDALKLGPRVGPRKSRWQDSSSVGSVRAAKKGFVFLTLEDETGMINVIVTPGPVRGTRCSSPVPLLLIRGVQVEGAV